MKDINQIRNIMFYNLKKKWEPLLLDNDLYTYNNSKFVDNKLYKYIVSDYFNDIYVCFHKSMRLLKKNIKLNDIKPMCCVLDLDESFFQNYSFLYNTQNIWKYNPRLYNKYSDNKFHNKHFGPVLPYMFILYKYLMSKNIHIIFLSGRNEKFRELTINNLSYFDITKGSYELILNDNNKKTNLYKQEKLSKISKNYNIVLCINDQNEFSHKNLIKMPQLYKIN